MDATVDAATAPRLSRKKMRRVLDRYRVTDGNGFRLASSTRPTPRTTC